MCVNNLYIITSRFQNNSYRRGLNPTFESEFALRKINHQRLIIYFEEKPYMLPNALIIRNYLFLDNGYLFTHSEIWTITYASTSQIFKSSQLLYFEINIKYERKKKKKKKERELSGRY